MPGLDRLLGMIHRTETRNKMIYAFVIALCISIWIYAQFLSGSSAIQVAPSTDSPIIIDNDAVREVPLIIDEQQLPGLPQENEVLASKI